MKPRYEYEMMKIECINCHEEFESDNEDDMVMSICPDCLDGNPGGQTGTEYFTDNDY